MNDQEISEKLAGGMLGVQPLPNPSDEPRLNYTLPQQRFWERAACAVLMTDSKPEYAALIADKMLVLWKKRFDL